MCDGDLGIRKARIQDEITRVGGPETVEMRRTVGSEHTPGEHPSVKSRKKEGTHKDERYWQVCKEKKELREGRVAKKE